MEDEIASIEKLDIDCIDPFDIKKPKDRKDLFDFGHFLGAPEYGVAAGFILDKARHDGFWVPHEISLVKTQKVVEMKHEGLLVRVGDGYLLTKKALAVLIEQCPCSQGGTMPTSIRLQQRKFDGKYFIAYLRREEPPLWKDTIIVIREGGVDHFHNPFVENAADLLRLATHIRQNFPNQRELEREAGRKHMAVTHRVWRP